MGLLFTRKTKQKVMRQMSQMVEGRLDSMSRAPFAPYMGNATSFAIPLEPEECERCDAGLPIPPKPLWLTYGNTSAEYVRSGKTHAETMLGIVKDSGKSLEGSRILDLGCAAGRMLRHLKPLTESGEVWGTDITAECIYWCRQNLSPPFRFATTTTIPHLPFEDGYFDLVYCGSVFTHIDDLAEAWLLEVRRVLAEDGRFFFTIHDERTVELLDGARSDHWLAQYMKSHEIYNEMKGKFAMLVVDRGSDSQVFYDRGYFCRNLELVFNTQSVTEEAYGYQTAILVSKPES